MSYIQSDKFMARCLSIVVKCNLGILSPKYAGVDQVRSLFSSF
jgi:hypothetical protein